MPSRHRARHVILDKVQAVLALFDAVQHMCDRDRQRFYFFDLGVRHAAAQLSNARDTVLADPEPLVEQWVGIEIWKRFQYRGEGALSYYRTKAGAEVASSSSWAGSSFPSRSSGPSIRRSRTRATCGRS